DSLKCYTLRRHRVVYGGGGIMPDEFVPLDTTQYTAFHRLLSAKGVILQQNLKYVDVHRKALKSAYPTFDTFLSGYEVPQSLVDSVLADGKRQKITPKNDAELQATLPILRQQLKALVARDLWDMSEYFQIINEQNHIVRKAVELIQNDKENLFSRLAKK
ncbi:MAG: peptidase S41, partial [Prevotella sp.]